MGTSCYVLNVILGDLHILSQWYFIPISLIRKTKAQVYTASDVRHYLCSCFTVELVRGGDGMKSQAG